MKLALPSALLLAACSLAAGAPSVAPSVPPNVLFVVIDDLNDLIGPLGAPHVRTPALDRLARRGTTFLQAQCPAPLCNPSRAAVLTGLRPTTTGIYGLSPSFRSVPALREHPTILQHFSAHGYATLVAGKVDHHGFASSPDRAAEADRFGPAGGPGDILPPRKLVGGTPNGDNRWVDWGALAHDESKRGDTLVVDWTLLQLPQIAGRPFFVAVGLFAPHVPCYVTPERLSRIPDDDAILPVVRGDDRDDLPRFARYLNWRLPEPSLTWLRNRGEWRNLVRAYLASIETVDEQLGRLLDGLDAAGLGERTLIVVWGDNGFHLGEKGSTGKTTLWERSTRVPLIVAGPGVAAGARVATPVDLVDLFPTLAELAGLPLPSSVDGVSLLPQLRDARAPRSRPALTTHNRGNHSLRTEHWRYIRYADGTEELYDHRIDPREWENVASLPAHKELLDRFRAQLPATEASPVAGSGGRTLDYDPTSGALLWEGRPIDTTANWPE